MSTDFKKLRIALKYYLIGKDYQKALHAFSFAESHHTGLRKDGITPEFQHQVEIALFVSTLKGVQHEQDAICVALLHDVMEDCGVEYDTLNGMFGENVAESVWSLTKKTKNLIKDKEQYIFDCATDINASIVKGADRINNVNTMVGVFSLEKQQSYIQEVENLILPMIKRAESNFPEQMFAYMNIKHMLKSQVRLLKETWNSNVIIIN